MHQPSVSWYLIPLKLKHMLWTKRAHSFRTFECTSESSPNSSCHFWNHMVRVYSNFAPLFSVMKELLKPHILSTKIALRSESLGLLSGWVFIKFLISYLKLQVSFFLNFRSLFSAMRSSALFSWNFVLFWWK